MQIYCYFYWFENLPAQMISVLIPVYNQKVVSLVTSLRKQAGNLRVDYEIVVLDDGSSGSFRKENAVIKEMDHVRYLEQPENTGRAAARNRLADEALHACLLFIDGDVVIAGESFLEDYLRYYDEQTVVCGGLAYYPEPPEDPAERLRFRAGVSRECLPPSVRRTHPYRSFMSSSFMIPAGLFHRIRFDERMKGYGHEDTLFGFRLKQEHIRIRHIDNPVIHGKTETGRKYLHKALEAAENLVKAWELTGYDPAFVPEVKLLRRAVRLRRLGLSFPVRKMVSLLREPAMRNLTGLHPRLFLLDLLKLDACLGALAVATRKTAC